MTVQDIYFQKNILTINYTVKSVVLSSKSFKL